MNTAKGKFKSWRKIADGPMGIVEMVILQLEDGRILASSEHRTHNRYSREIPKEYETIESACIGIGYPHEYLGLPELK